MYVCIIHTCIYTYIIYIYTMSNRMHTNTTTCIHTSTPPKNSHTIHMPTHTHTLNESHLPSPPPTLLKHTYINIHTNIRASSLNESHLASPTPNTAQATRAISMPHTPQLSRGCTARGRGRSNHRPMSSNWRGSSRGCSGGLLCEIRRGRASAFD